MRCYNRQYNALVVALILTLCNNQLSLAHPQSVIPRNRVIGSLVGTGTGAIAGSVAGRNVGAYTGVDTTVSIQDGNGDKEGSRAYSPAYANKGGSYNGISMSNDAYASGSSSSGSQASSSVSVAQVSSTPKSEGLVSKVKDMIKEGKEKLISSIENVIKDDKKDEKKISAEASIANGSLQVSGGASVNMASNNNPPSLGLSSTDSLLSGSSSQQGSYISGTVQALSGSQSSSSAQASISIRSSTPKPEGLVSKVKDMIKEGKEMFKSSIENVIKDDKKDEKKISAEALSGSQSSSSAQASISIGSSTPKPEGIIEKISELARKGKETIKEALELKKDEKKEEKNASPIDKVQKLVTIGTDAVRSTMHIFEDKAHEVGEKITKAVDEHLFKPMKQVSGSGQQTSEGQLSVQASANAQLRGAEKEKYLVEMKKKQESELLRPSNLKEAINDAKSRGVIPQNEDRSVLKGNHIDEKSMTVEVFDKAHEMSKIPVETMLKPIDKMLGYEKDPLMRMYDNSHEILRKPLDLVAKPVESILTGAFKTSEESKRDNEKLLATKSEQERKEAKLKEEKARIEDRSVVGEIADKTFELATKPIEIVLRPIDHIFGSDKDGTKSPILKALNYIYNMSKKPFDSIAKPFESILRKMADNDQVYQMSIRFDGDKDDPKIITRLADGALNIFDRVLTKPLEIVMKPLNHALGYDEPGKKNPITEAAHSLKDVTKLGAELLTKPIDRIIKEIASIGAYKNDADREADYERQKDQASRLVKALDKFHEFAQAPFEIVLRPMSQVLGISKDDRKEPLLRAWDVIHQIVRAPIQVISKPVEDAILGEQEKKQRIEGGSGQLKASASGGIGGVEAGASISIVGGKDRNMNGKMRQARKEEKKNIFVELIKKVERFATKPFDLITSPIRRMILGEDNEKVGSETDKNNREIQAKANAGNNQVSVSAQVKASSGQGEEKHGDKILTTLDRLNNVILKPLEVITQPISDMINSDKRHAQKNEKNFELKAQGQVLQSQLIPQQTSLQAQAQMKNN